MIHVFSQRVFEVIDYVGIWNVCTVPKLKMSNIYTNRHFKLTEELNFNTLQHIVIRDYELNVQYIIFYFV